MSQTATTQIVYLPDVRARAVERLLAQFRDKPRIVALVSALAAGGQLSEDLSFSLIFSRRIEASSGAQLDQWGALVGEPRGGLDDDDYRRFIRARLLANRTSSTTDDIIRIAQLTTEPSEVRHYTMYPAGYTLYVLRRIAMTEVMRRRVRRMLDSVKPAGVQYHAIEAVDGYFGFAEDPVALGYNRGRFSRVI